MDSMDCMRCGIVVLMLVAVLSPPGCRSVTGRQSAAALIPDAGQPAQTEARLKPDGTPTAEQTLMMVALMVNNDPTNPRDLGRSL